MNGRPQSASVASSARSGGKRAQTREQNRRIILEAARNVFAEQGYGATNVRDIIRATPLASGTFYNYFKSKEEVFQAIRDEAALAVRPRLHDERVKAKTATAFVAGTFRTFFHYVASNQRGYAAIKHSDPLHVRVDTPEIVAGFEELRHDIEAAIGRGLFPQVDAGLLTGAMVGIAFETAEIMQKRVPIDPEAATLFATALVMGGMETLPKVAIAPEGSSPG